MFAILRQKQMQMILPVIFLALGSMQLIADDEATVSPRGTINIYSEMVHPIDFNHMRVNLTYHRPRDANEKVLIELPARNKGQMPGFRGLEVKFDGKAASFKLDGINIALSRRENLKPGQSAKLTVPLSTVIEIPREWKVMEVKPTRSHVGGNGFEVSAVVHR